MEEINQISVQNISVAYNKKVVLENLSIEIKCGEFVAIVGKSGTGKTTLLNALAGFIRCKGTIIMPKSIGFCFQNNSLFYWMTVKENIIFGLDRMDLKEKSKTQKFKVIREKIPKRHFPVV